MVGINLDNLFILYKTFINTDCNLYSFFDSLNVLLGIIANIT